MGRKNRSEERKREILQQCNNVIEAVGFDNTTFAKIADDMGVTPALLVHYFGTKENMFLEMVDYLFENQTRYLQEIRESEPDPRMRMKKTLDYFLGDEVAAYFGNNVFYGCFYLSLRSEALKERFQRIVGGYDAHISEEVRMFLQATGKAHLDPERITFLIISLLEGLDFYDAMEMTKIGRSARVEEIKGVIWQQLEEEEPC